MSESEPGNPPTAPTSPMPRPDTGLFSRPPGRELVTAIVGGGKGCAAILKMIEEDQLGRFPMRVVGVADPDPDGPGMRYAREVGVEVVTQDYRDLYEIDDLDLIVELTGSDAVRDEIEATRPRQVRLIDHFGARLFWQLHRAEEAIHSQRLQLQKQVEVERARMEAILDSIPDEVVVLDTDMVIQHANASYLRNNDLELEDVRGCYCYDAGQKTRGQCEVAMGTCPAAEVLRDKRVTSVVRKHFENGKPRYATILGAPLVDREGNVTGMIEMIRDTTDSIKLEEELAAKEVRLQTFMEKAPLAIYIKNRSGRYIEVNPRTCELLGREKREILGNSDLELLPSEAAQAFREGDQDVLRQGQTVSIESEVTLGRRQVFLSTIKYPVLDAEGNVTALCGLTRDRTERHKVEDELTFTEGYLQNILDNAPTMVITSDLDGCIVTFNRRSQDVLGYTADEVIGKPTWLLYRQLDQWTSLLRRVTRGELVHDYEATLVCKDGSPLPVSMNLAGLRDSDGQLIGTVGMGRDTSARQALFKRIVQSERLAAVGRLAAGVAHEINNPLAIMSEIAGHLEDLVTGVTPSDPGTLEEHLKRFLPRIGVQVERCRSITSRLLSFSGKDEVKLEWTNPNQALEEVLPLLEQQARLADIALHREYDDNLPPVRINEVQFEELILNLVTNAIQAMAERRRGNIWLRSALEDSMLVFSVIDDGPGIAEEVYDRLFDPFVTTKPVGQGTGLGLSICFGIVRRYDGEIRVESEPGKGARFDVVLHRMPDANGPRQ